MSDDQNTTETGNENTPSQPTPSGSPKLDQMLSVAQRIAEVARQRARQVADAAAPHIKSASDAAGRLMDERVRPGSPLGKARHMLGSAGGKGKLVLAGAVLLLFMIVMGILGVVLQRGSGSTSSNSEKDHLTNVTPARVASTPATSPSVVAGGFWPNHSGTWTIQVHFLDDEVNHFARCFKITVNDSGISKFTFWIKTHEPDTDAATAQELPSSKFQVISTGDNDARVMTGVAGNIALVLHFDGSVISGYGNLDDGSEKKVTGTVE